MVQYPARPSCRSTSASAATRNGWRRSPTRSIWERRSNGIAMSSDQTFRAVLVVTLVSVVLIAVSGRLRARTNEKLDRRQEGLFMLVTLRPVGLALWAGIIAYTVDPASMAWSAVPL